MKYDSLGQTLEQSLNNPKSWVRQAEQQFLVAKAIAPNIRIRPLNEENCLLQVGYLKATVLLLSLSIENSLKAIKASKNEFKVDSRGLIKESLGGGKSVHSLLKHAKEVGLVFSSNQINLLDNLTKIGIWAGKFHTPIHHSEFENSNQTNPISLTLPNDFNVALEILSKSAELSGVPSLVSLGEVRTPTI